MNENLIEARDLRVKRQGSFVLRDISLTIGSHDFITVIGPNGAGKSMLLKALMGFYKPDSGQVNQRPGLKIGYVPQRFTADMSLPITARRFLALRKKKSADEYAAIIEKTALATLLDKPLYVLSGGELQRVLLARALLDKPDILILDEPAQSLDISGQLSFYKLLEQIYIKEKLSILMVSHDLHMVMASTRQVICLYHHVCCSGTPQMVTRHPEFSALFGQDMAHMMAAYQHHHNHQHENTNV